MHKKISRQMIACMARQSLKSSRMRNVFVMITILLASALLTVVMLYGVGQQTQAREQVSHIQQAGFYNLTQEQADALAGDERIYYQVLAKTGTLSPMDGFDVMPCYVSALSDEIQIAALSAGRLPEEMDEIAAQSALLQRMGVTPELGARVTLSFADGNTETFTVSGLIQGGEEAKQFSVFFSREYAESGSQLKDAPYEVYTKFYAATQMDAATCKEMIYQVGSDAGVERKYIQPTKAFLDTLSPDSGMVVTVVLVGVVILLACVLVIYGVFYLSVVGRVHQFGQLRTLGMTQKQIKRLVSREGAALFLCAAPLGLIIGSVAGYFILPDGFRVLNTFLVCLTVFVVTGAITGISVLKPARMAASVSPMEALRYVPQDGMRQSSGRRLCRDLTPVGLGVMNFSRNRKKAVVTMLSLCLGGLLFMTAATYMASFDRAAYGRQGDFANAEFNITFSGDAIELDENGASGIQSRNPLNDALLQQILNLDGVRSVEQRREFGVRYDFPAHDEYGTDDLVYPMSEAEVREIGQYLASGSADFDKLMSGDYVLVCQNATVQEIYGWSFQPGDALTFHYYDGVQTAQRTVQVLGVLNDQYTLDHGAASGWFLTAEQAVLSWASYPSLNTQFLVSLDDPALESQVEPELAQLVADRPELTMATLSENQALHEDSANQIFAAISGLSIFIMMFSILSMMNTLIANIVTRKQELAVLESIGMCGSQVRRMLLGESLLMVGITLAVTVGLGTLCGFALCRALYGMGAFYMAFRFPLPFTLAYAAVLILVPLLITVCCMRSFSREALVERLRGVAC